MWLMMGFPGIFVFAKAAAPVWEAAADGVFR
jgi:hypothetical protein